MVGIAQLVSAPDCGSGGRGFESHYPPYYFVHKICKIIIKIVIKNQLIIAQQKYFIIGHLIPDTKLT